MDYFRSWMRNPFSPRQNFRKVYAIGVPEGKDRFGEHVKNVVLDLAKKLEAEGITVTCPKVEDLGQTRVADEAIVVVLITQGRVGDEIEAVFPETLLTGADAPAKQPHGTVKAAGDLRSDLSDSLSEGNDNGTTSPQVLGGQPSGDTVNTGQDKGDDNGTTSPQVLGGQPSGDTVNTGQDKGGRKLILLVVQDDEYARFNEEDLPASLRDKIHHVLNIHVIPGKSHLHISQSCRNSKVIEELKEILKK